MVLGGHLWGLLAGERTRVSLHPLFHNPWIDLWASERLFGEGTGPYEERLGQGQGIC